MAHTHLEMKGAGESQLPEDGAPWLP